MIKGQDKMMRADSYKSKKKGRIKKSSKMVKKYHERSNS